MNTEHATESSEEEAARAKHQLGVRMQMVTLFLLTIVIAYLSVLILKPFLPVILWSIALGVAGSPLHRRIHTKIQSPGLAAGITVVLVGVTLVLPLMFTARQLTATVSDNADVIADVLDPDPWREVLQAHPSMLQAFNWADEYFGLREGATQLSGALLDWTRTLITGSVWSILQLLLVFFTLFYLFRDREKVLRGVRMLLPLREEESSRMLREIYDTVYATLYGTVLVSIIQGALGALMFWILGISGVIVWGIIMAIVSVVPYLGPFVVWAPVALYLAVQGEAMKATILAVWGGTVVAFMDNLLYPIFVGRRMRFHTLPVFFFLLGGIAFFGASGLILGPVVLALGDGLIRVWRERTEAT